MEETIEAQVLKALSELQRTELLTESEYCLSQQPLSLLLYGLDLLPKHLACAFKCHVSLTSSHQGASVLQKAIYDGL